LATLRASSIINNTALLLVLLQ